MKSSAPFVAFSLLVLSCGHPAPPRAPAAPAPPPAAAENPFAQPSTLPFELPPFDKITDASFRPAFQAGMKADEAEIEKIAQNPDAPTFDNTIVAMEKSGAELTRVSKVFFNLEASNTDDTMEKIAAEMAPKLAAHRDRILLNDALFARVDTLYGQRDQLGLDPESLQLLERYEDMFVHAGAKLGDQDKTRLKQINERLSTLATQFRQNVLHATTDNAVVVDEVKQLDGMSDAEIAAAAQAAKGRDLDGKWLISLQNTTRQPVLAELTDRALRKRIFEASSTRADGGKDDNTAVVAETMKLRAEKAKLLGYPSYAAYALVEESAGTPEAVDQMLGQLAPAALAKAHEEADAIQAQMDADQEASGGEHLDLQPWDWAFYAEQVRKAHYDFDASQVKPYFELEHVLKDGVFYAATQLYGITFTERKDLPMYRPDVRCFEVKDADGTSIGLILLDYYARDNKQGGAWMDAFVGHSTLLDHKPVVVNNLNLEKPAPGQPTLMTYDEVETAFHEFGHALHGLFSSVKYPMLSGTNTPPDFVEYPSQFNEMWAREPAVLQHYAKHYETGEPMPKELFDKVIAATRFNEGFDTSEYLEAAILDQSWHALPADQIPDAAGVMDFEAKALQDAHVAYAPVPPRYHTPYFSHIFNGGYAAGYYAYIWSEVLARDTGAWFHEHGGLSREPGDTYRKDILSKGRTMEPNAMFEAFYGGPPTIEPLLEYHGLILPSDSAKEP